MNVDGDTIKAAAELAVGLHLRAHPGQARYRDDLLSDAQLGAVKGAANYHPETGAPLTWWLRYKARGEILEGIRRRCAVPACAPLTTDPGVVERGYAAVEARAVLARALTVLPARDRQVIVEVDLHGRLQQDVAAELGVSPERVCQIRSRALCRMRQAVAA